MSDLTREEIRAAAEAVGWEWHDGDPNRVGYLSEVDRAYDKYGGLRMLMGCVNENDALPLLEATGEPFEISYAPGTRHPYAIRKPAHANGPNLLVAAVRAVNAWAKAKREET